MPPAFIVDPKEIDISHIVAGPDDIRKYNPHRFEVEQVHAILRYDTENQICIGLRHIRPDEWWCAGHIPGRPIFPGVLMCEYAAQTCSYYFMRSTGFNGFLGFGGLENVKFRGTVVPGDDFVMVTKVVEIRPRRAVFNCQGFVKDQMAYQGTILGMAV